MKFSIAHPITTKKDIVNHHRTDEFMTYPNNILPAAEAQPAL